jgi:hypothetical protein
LVWLGNECLGRRWEKEMSCQKRRDEDDCKQYLTD